MQRKSHQCSLPVVSNKHCFEKFIVNDEVTVESLLLHLMLKVNLNDFNLRISSYKSVYHYGSAILSLTSVCIEVFLASNEARLNDICFLYRNKYKSFVLIRAQREY